MLGVGHARWRLMRRSVHRSGFVGGVSDHRLELLEFDRDDHANGGATADCGPEYGVGSFRHESDVHAVCQRHTSNSGGNGVSVHGVVGENLFGIDSRWVVHGNCECGGGESGNVECQRRDRCGDVRSFADVHRPGGSDQVLRIGLGGAGGVFHDHTVG